MHDLILEILIELVKEKIGHIIVNVIVENLIETLIVISCIAPMVLIQPQIVTEKIITYSMTVETSYHNFFKLQQQIYVFADNELVYTEILDVYLYTFEPFFVVLKILSLILLYHGLLLLTISRLDLLVTFWRNFFIFLEYITNTFFRWLNNRLDNMAKKDTGVDWIIGYAFVLYMFYYFMHMGK